MFNTDIIFKVLYFGEYICISENKTACRILTLHEVLYFLLLRCGNQYTVVYTIVICALIYYNSSTSALRS